MFFPRALPVLCLTLLSLSMSVLSTARARAQLGCKRVHFVRHAEAMHNKDSREKKEYYAKHHRTERYRDTRLTELGVQQATLLGEKIGASGLADKVQVVVSSPLRRAMETATLAFHHELAKVKAPIVATELARERIAMHTCDWRSARSTLETEFPHVDFAMIESEDDLLWQQKEIHPDEYNSRACQTRGMSFLSFLMERQEEEIAVVSHWVFMQHLFRNFDKEFKFENAQLISMQLCSSDVDGLKLERISEECEAVI